MIEYLEKLIHERDYRKALEVAERMLGEGRREPRELLVINSALFTSRYHLGQYLGAAEVGPTVMGLARDLEEWDVHGAACVDLSATYHDLNRHGDAIQILQEYLENLSRYQNARKFEFHAWYNLGRSLMALGNYHEATEAFDRAVLIGNASGNYRLAHSSRHALIEALLQTPSLDRIPGLLATSASFLRRNARADNSEESWLFHLRLRAEYALLTARYKRARCIIARGLMLAESKPRHLFDFHILLTRLGMQVGDVAEALEHAATAKINADLCRRHDLGSQAAQLGYRLSHLAKG